MRIPLLISFLMFTSPALADIAGCEGDCDVLSPLTGGQVKFEDTEAKKRWGAALGGLSGAIIGEEIGGAPGAIGFGLLGAALGYEDQDKRWQEEQALKQNAAWQRGDDMFYNPAHPLPANPHWMGGAKKSKK